MKKQFIIIISMVVASLILAIISYFLLPTAVVIQFSLGAQNKTVPKLFAIMISVIFVIAGAVNSFFKKNGKSLFKYGLISIIVGDSMLLFTIFVNCILLK